MSGNYSPMGERRGPFPAALPSQVRTSGEAYTGVGSPEGLVPGMPGQLYKDNNTHDLWLKMAGTGETGWQNIGVAPS